MTRRAANKIRLSDFTTAEAWGDRVRVAEIYVPFRSVILTHDEIAKLAAWSKARLAARETKGGKK